MAASDKKPSIYSNRDNLIGYTAKTAVRDYTVYQPFKGFYVTGGGDVAYMDWDGNDVLLTSVLNGTPIWVSGQRINTSASGTSAGTLILFQ